MSDLLSIPINNYTGNVIVCQGHSTLPKSYSLQTSEEGTSKIEPVVVYRKLLLEGLG